MRITLLAFGTRGDVTPCVALGVGLRDAGHAVRVATFAEFEPLVRRNGLDYHRVSGSFERLIATQEGRRALGVPHATPLGARGVFLPFRGCADAVFAECWEACADAEAIGTSLVALVVATLVARGRDVPLVQCQAIPSVRSWYLPQSTFPPWPLGPLYNRATYAIASRLLLRAGSTELATWFRAARRVAPGTQGRSVRSITLIAASPAVVPRPGDWPGDVHLTGYWFLPNDVTGGVPEGLDDFIAGGSPPICFGFGSMGDNDPEELRCIVADVLSRLRLRAVIVGGSGGALSGVEDSDTVRSVPFVDYGWLFPRMAAVVHQGGAGTGSFCLTAGIPQVCVPYCLDHRFWSWRLEQLGVAPSPTIRSKLTRARLTRMIRRVIEEPAFLARARRLAPVIRAEKGVELATQLVNRHLGVTRSPETISAASESR